MTYSDAKDYIAELARSQGFYGRLLREMENFDEEQENKFKKFIQPLNDELDLVIALES